MHIKDVEKLKAWLLKRLSPLCDADPSALSKYIVALLRKEKPRSALKELCINQLEVFLSKETPLFVDNLFISLDNDSYLSGSKENSPSTPSTLPTKVTPTNRAGSEGVVKGNNEKNEQRRTTDDSRHREVDDDDRDFRRAKVRQGSPISVGGDQMGGDRGQRKRRADIEPPKRSIKQRLGPKEDDYRNNRRPHPSRRRSHSRSRSSTPEFVSSQEEDNGGRKRSHNDQKTNAPKRQRCKDYDEKGMCLLGEQCPFDHGIDPVVITGPIPPPYPPPAPPHFSLSMPPPPPHTNNGLMLQPSMMQPPPPMMTTASSVDGYNPEDPSLNASSNILPPHLPPPHLPPPHIHHSMMPIRPNFPTMPPGLPGIGMAQPILPNISPSIHQQMGGANVSITTAPRSSVGVTKPPFKLSDTLVLRKVPRELNTITKLSGHFEKFGTIVNLQVRYENDPESAIVQFTNPQEAKKAHDSVEAVLNNRFIKVYYLKNNGQQPFSLGQKENYKTTTQHTVRPDTTPTSSYSNTTAHTTPITSQAPPTQPNSVPQQPSIHVQKQLAKQEALNNVTQKRLEVQRRTQSLIDTQIKEQKLLLNKLEKSGNTLSPFEKTKVIETLKSLSSSIGTFKSTIASCNKTAQLKPIHPQRQAHSSPDTNHSLQQTAEKLRNEAQQLGILPGKHGGMAHSRPLPVEDGGDLRNKLEGKPCQLLVINSVSDKDQLVKYFESFGGLNQVECDPESNRNLIFTFRNRNTAEKAVQGSIFKGKPLIMKWYNPKPLKSPSLPPDQQQQPNYKRTVTIENDSNSTTNTEQQLKDVNKLNTLSEKDIDELLQERQDSESPLVVESPPNQSKPRVVHLLDDDEEEEDRSWRR